jgi:hypothetical protein
VNKDALKFRLLPLWSDEWKKELHNYDSLTIEFDDDVYIGCIVDFDIRIWEPDLLDTLSVRNAIIEQIPLESPKIALWFSLGLRILFFIIVMIVIMVSKK